MKNIELSKLVKQSILIFFKFLQFFLEFEPKTICVQNNFLFNDC